MWINTFTRVNIHPFERIKLSDWTENIEGFLISGFIFKNFNLKPNTLEKFALLPHFWWEMSPKETKTAVEIVRKYGETHMT